MDTTPLFEKCLEKYMIYFLICYESRQIRFTPSELKQISVQSSSFEIYNNFFKAEESGLITSQKLNSLKLSNFSQITSLVIRSEQMKQLM